MFPKISSSKFFQPVATSLKIALKNKTYIVLNVSFEPMEAFTKTLPLLLFCQLWFSKNMHCFIKIHWAYLWNTIVTYFRNIYYFKLKNLVFQSKYLVFRSKTLDFDRNTRYLDSKILKYYVFHTMNLKY